MMMYVLLHNSVYGIRIGLDTIFEKGKRKIMNEKAKKKNRKSLGGEKSFDGVRTDMNEEARRAEMTSIQKIPKKLYHHSISDVVDVLDWGECELHVGPWHPEIWDSQLSLDCRYVDRASSWLIRVSVI